jgi:hypothetical protein
MSMQALIINEFTGEKFTCDDPTAACESTGEMVIARLNFDVRNIKNNPFHQC